MFRHFLEALVRIARCRYPSLSEVDQQIQKLISEKIVRADGNIPIAQSERIFDFAKKSDIKEIFSTHDEKLRKVFEHNSIGSASFASSTKDDGSESFPVPASR